MFVSPATLLNFYIPYQLSSVFWSDRTRKIACMTDIIILVHQGLVLDPLLLHISACNAPYQFIPLLNLNSYFWFDAIWLLLVYLHLFISFSHRNIIVYLCPLSQEHN
jgi:hypothetical protein